MMKQIMKRAWELAKQGVATFGGKVREYFATSLSIAWKEIKSMTNEIVLVGSEKQVKWAMDIRTKLATLFDAVDAITAVHFEQSERLTEENKAKYQAEVKAIQDKVRELLNEQNAKAYIEQYCDVNSFNVIEKIYEAVKTAETRRGYVIIKNNASLISTYINNPSTFNLVEKKNK